MSPSADTDTGIPVIDISNPSPETAQKILDAASTHGFLFIKNDGVTIPPQDIAEMFKLSRDFFAQPAEKKSEYAIHSEKAGGLNRGWVTMEGESLDPEGEKKGDPKEAFNIAPPQGPHPTLQPLPTPLSTSSPLILRFQSSCHHLCTRILSLLNTALAISDPDYLSSRHDLTAGPSGTIFRMLYYPASTSSSSSRIRAGAHSDYGSLTLLFREEGESGLELLRKPADPSADPADGKGPKAGKDSDDWVSVPVNPLPLPTATSSSSGPHSSQPPPPPPPILVNIGDLLSFWTNGMLKSTVHRVTFSGSDSSSSTTGRVSGGQERYSMAYFCHPLDSAKLDAVPSRVIEAYGDQGREELEGQRRKVDWRDGEVLSARGHLDRRLRVTYGLEG